MLPVEDHVVAGVRCAVQDSGPRTLREAVVFVHGNPGPLDDWEVLAPAIARWARVVAMDMPGFGRAERPRDFEYTIDGYARYLGAVLDHLGVEHPERVASLTLINCGVLEGYRWHLYARIWQTPVLGELFQLLSRARAMHAALNRSNPRPMPWSFVERIARYADWGHKRAVLKLYRSARRLPAFSDPRGLRLAETVPTCVLWGAGDPYVPVAYAERQRESFRRAEVHVLPGLGHWPFVDDPEAVLQPLEAFLRRHWEAAVS